MTSPPIALSLGDPAGVGPEITIDAWRALCASGPMFVVVGDARALEYLGAPVARVRTPAAAASCFREAVPVLHAAAAAPTRPGLADPANAAAIIAWIETAAGLALRGEASALVTAPVAKALLYGAGFPFPGHTEFLGALAGEAHPLMMLAAGDLRCALVTVHTALAAAPGLVTIEAIVRAGLTLDAALRRDFGVADPRIAVAALNPHAGESGALGSEEREIITPAIEALHAAGVQASGPHPADTMFHADARARYDAALCMYHDQALIPVKMLDFWGGVNVTLGLPFVRTSPDHGVAYDIAGRGLARCDSLVAALRMADALAARRTAA